MSFQNKKVLVTGASGTVGAELVRQLLNKDKYQPSEVVCIDNNESEIFFLEQQFLNDKRFNARYADVRDYERLEQVMAGIDIVFHAAGLKHVVVCERSPFDAVQTNIIGVQNIIRAATKCGVEKVVFTSTDKAVNPTNVMGTSKLMGERLITAANTISTNSDGKPGCKFASTRFGNVLGSRGSVLPIFKKQISLGGPITLTDPEMTRFIMSIEEAVELVINTADVMVGGEVFVTKMPVAKISDIAAVMVDELAAGYDYKPEDIEIKIIGTKPGEKLYEELMSDEETRRSREVDQYFVITPAFSSLYDFGVVTYPGERPEPVTNPYNSSIEPALSKSEVKAFLSKHDMLQKVAGDEPQRYWPGDKEDKNK